VIRKKKTPSAPAYLLVAEKSACPYEMSFLYYLNKRDEFCLVGCDPKIFDYIL
jgi:hypothetical protein